MSKTKKKWVKFRTNATIPAKVTGDKKDHKMRVGEAVQLPGDYADHVVHDGFAVFCDAPKKPLEQFVEGDVAAKLDAAKFRVDDLTAKLAEISEEDEGLEDLAKELAKAEAEFAALQSAS